MQEPIFKGLVFSDQGKPLSTVKVGEAWFYVLEDSGFDRHIAARPLDESILRWLWDQIRGHEKELAEQAARMTGQEDIFSRAVLQRNLEHPEQQMDQILDAGLPENTRLWLGMMGLRAIVNFHGELVRVEQPSAPADDSSE
jgi:hypothetical protein